MTSTFAATDTSRRAGISGSRSTCVRLERWGRRSTGALAPTNSPDATSKRHLPPWPTPTGVPAPSTKREPSSPAASPGLDDEDTSASIAGPPARHLLPVLPRREGRAGGDDEAGADPFIRGG